MSDHESHTDSRASRRGKDDTVRAGMPDPGPECRTAVLAGRSPGETALHLPDGVVSWAELNGLVGRRAAERGDAPSVLAVRATPALNLVVEILTASWRGRAIALVPPRLPAGPADRFVLEAGAEWLNPPTPGPASSPRPASPPEPAPAAGSVRERLHARIPSPDAPLTLMQTSGSSGRPRIIAHSWRNHTTSARLAAAALDLGEDDRWFWSLPPHHVGGLSILFRCLESGASLVLPESTESRPDPDAAADAVRVPDSEVDTPGPEETLRAALERTESTIVSCVPVQLHRMVREGPCPPSLRTVIVGGAPVEANLVRDAIAAGYPVRTTYGCTESSSMVTLSARFTAAPDIVHAGTPLEYGAVEAGADGSIRVRGAVVAAGAVERGDLLPITNDGGWYETGDIGRFDEGGHLIVEGRTDDVFISGGENISARTVEEALADLDGVNRVVVVPVPHPEYGQRPAAFLDVEGDLPDSEAVGRHLAGRLPRFMHPDVVMSLGPPPAGYLKWPRDLLVRRATSIRKD